MTPWRFLARHALREARALVARGALFVLCLATGVAAVVAVSGMGDGIEQGLALKARDLMAADVIARSRQPLPPAVVEAARALPGARVTDNVQLFSMLARADGGGEGPRSRLVEVKAVGPGWPYHGSVTLDPARPLDELLAPDAALVAPEVAQRLGLAIGSRVTLGTRTLRVAGFVLEESDAPIGRIALAPRVLVRREILEGAGLMGPGSRREHVLLVGLPEGADAVRAGEALVAAAGRSPFVEVETWRDAQPGVREEVRRAERFLGLVALLSLVIGGAGIAQAAQAWLRSRMDAIAILRCLGLRARDVLLLHAGLAALLGLIGAALGVGAGTLALRAAPAILGETYAGLPIATWQPAAILRGAGLGLFTALAFSIPALVDLVRVPPLRALRASVEAPPQGRVLRVLVLAALIVAGVAAALVQSGSIVQALAFVAGLLAAAALLALGARLLARALPALAPARGRAWLRLALTAARRPDSGVLGATVALGLGVLVVTLVVLVQRGVRQELLARLPDAAPSAFLLDVQPAQWPAVKALLLEHGATNVGETPLVTARLARIDGREVADIAKEREEEGGREAWVLTREQRLTWWTELPADNELVAGALWSHPDVAEVSIEEEYARDLGIGVGARLVMDVQGVPVELLVSSLRKVEWRTFRINFFLVVEPGVLEKAPHQVLAAARLPDGRETAVQDALVALAPNVTLVPVRDALARAAAFVERLAAGIQAVGALSVVAGVAILAGAVAAGASRRGAEIAVLRAIGMTSREAARMLLVEHAAIGLVAAIVGALAASALSVLVLVTGLELPWHLRPGLLAIAILAAVALAALAGTLASLGALRRRPVEVLRREE